MEHAENPLLQLVRVRYKKGIKKIINRDQTRDQKTNNGGIRKRNPDHMKPSRPHCTIGLQKSVQRCRMRCLYIHLPSCLAAFRSFPCLLDSFAFLPSLPFLFFSFFFFSFFFFLFSTSFVPRFLPCFFLACFLACLLACLLVFSEVFPCWCYFINFLIQRTFFASIINYITVYFVWCLPQLVVLGFRSSTCFAAF